MLLKTIILLLLLGLIISLASGLVFLFKDVGETRRTLHSLGVRITLAAALMATVVYGFFSGQLEMGAPWDARKFQQLPAQPAQTDATSEAAAGESSTTKQPAPAE